MLRSIIAVTFGVLIGVTVVIFASFIVAQMLTEPTSGGAEIVSDMTSLPFANQAGIVAVWFAGTFLSTATTLLIARKWAPTSWVVAGTMAIFASSNYSGYPSPVWMLIATLIGICFAAWLSVLATRSTYGRSPNAEGRISQ
jgi:hypothetical protein